MVVEYLESSMSRDLLCKFPDNSCFDFDYSQSSIWSPLIHPSFSSTKLTIATKNVHSCGISKRLAYDDGGSGLTKIKNVTANFKRKFTDAVSDNLQKYQNLKKRKRKNSLDFSPILSSNKFPSTSSTPRKVLFASAFVCDFFLVLNAKFQNPQEIIGQFLLKTSLDQQSNFSFSVL